MRDDAAPGPLMKASAPFGENGARPLGREDARASGRVTQMNKDQELPAELERPLVHRVEVAGSSMRSTRSAMQSAITTISGLHTARS
jgi:hypothetical protein